MVAGREAGKTAIHAIENEQIKKETLKRLLMCMGIPGYEDEVREVIKEELQPISDEITVDKIGNIIGTRRGRSGTPTLMFASHMDVPGFMVRHIDDKGYNLLKYNSYSFSAITLPKKIQ